jgi:sporulation integral membrane protein YtvI
MGAYLVVKHLLFAIAPIIIAFLLSAAVYYTAGKISAKVKIPRGVCAVFLLTAIIALLGIGIFYACRQILLEVKTILDDGGIQSLPFFEKLIETLKGIRLTSVFVTQTEEYATEQLDPLIARLLSSLESGTSAVLSRLVSTAPTALISGILTLICCYYLSVNFDRVLNFLLCIMPMSVRRAAIALKSGVLSVAWGYLRGSAILFLVTFFEVLVGLLILCPSYAWLWALIIAAIDVLPVFGAGAVLIPWAIACFFNGEYALGVGLLVMYMIITVVRQIAEPYVLGKGLGLNQLVSLTAMLIGFRLYGAIGMLISPMIVSMFIKIKQEKDRLE